MQRTKEEVRPRMSAAASVADKTGFYLLSICGVLAPIPLGSNTATAAGAIGLLLAICLIGSPLVPPANDRVRRLLNLLMVLSGLLMLWTTMQALQWRAIDPLSAISVAAGQPSEETLRPTLHLQPLHSIGYVLIPIAAFMSALIYVRDDTRYIALLHILLGAGFAVTTFCIIEYMLSPQTLLLQPKIYYRDSFTGTFVNPNTAATYFGIMLLLSLSICLRQLGEAQLYRQFLGAGFWTSGARTFVVYFVWTFVFAVALLLTRSRAGILSSLAGATVLVWAYAFAALRANMLRTRAAIISSFCAAAALGVISLFAERLHSRLETEGLVDTARLCTYRSTWRAIQDNFWLGTGLGSFQDVFPAYRLPECGFDGYWEMAHSVYLEAWLSLGAGFLILLVIIYYQLIKTYVFGYRQRRRFRFVPLASLGILLLLTLHSLVDFSVQIPAIAVLAALVLGSGAAISVASRSPSHEPRRRRA